MEKKIITSSTPVYQVRVDNKLSVLWKSIDEAALAFDITPAGIIECCQGKRETYCGQRWKLVEDYINDEVNKIKAEEQMAIIQKQILEALQ